MELRAQANWSSLCGKWIRLIVTLHRIVLAPRSFDWMGLGIEDYLVETQGLR